jgi:hypothetical protein
MALAALGDVETAVSQDSQKLKAVRRAQISQGSYTIHEIVTDTSTIREYVSHAGVVFAVTWKGMKRPDLSVLLGSHYSEYSQKAAALPKAKGRQPVMVKTSRAIVVRGGHMRDIHGKAYLPDEVPAGVDMEDIR